MKTYTLVYVEKVKDVESGGQLTDFDVPLMCEFNNGLGFKIDGVNPLQAEQLTQEKPLGKNEVHVLKPLKPDPDFMKIGEEERAKEKEYDWLDKPSGEVDFIN
jgi:hypothetical protein